MFTKNDQSWKYVWADYAEGRWQEASTEKSNRHWRRSEPIIITSSSRTDNRSVRNFRGVSRCSRLCCEPNILDEVSAGGKICSPPTKAQVVRIIVLRINENYRWRESIIYREVFERIRLIIDIIEFRNALWARMHYMFFCYATAYSYRGSVLPIRHKGRWWWRAWLESARGFLCNFNQWLFYALGKSKCRDHWLIRRRRVGTGGKCGELSVYELPHQIKLLHRWFWTLLMLQLTNRQPLHQENFKRYFQIFRRQINFCITQQWDIFKVLWLAKKSLNFLWWCPVSDWTGKTLPSQQCSRAQLSTEFLLHTSERT